MVRTLTIQSVEYGLPVRALNRIGEMVLHAFDGIFDNLAIHTHGQIMINRPVDPRILLYALSSDASEYKVGVVASDLNYDNDPSKWGFEFAYNGSPGVVVSTHRLDPSSYGESDMDLLVRRTSVEAIHGLGHNFRLPHHPKRETKKGNLCPMSRFDVRNWYDYLLRIVDERDLNFCDPCYSVVSTS